jgi:hypothetical protein
VFVRYALRSGDPAELAAVNALMDQTTVVPLSQWLANDRRPLRAEDQPAVVGNYPFVPRMAELTEIATSITGVDLLQLVSLVLNDPTLTRRDDSAKELTTLDQLARIGLAPGSTFDPERLSHAQRAVVEDAFGAAKRESAEHVLQSYQDSNGWRAPRRGWRSTSTTMSVRDSSDSPRSAPRSRRRHTPGRSATSTPTVTR